MKKLYLISDNQYFMLGAATLLKVYEVCSLSPGQFIDNAVKINNDVCLVYIRDRDKYIEICKAIRHHDCELIFLLDVGENCIFSPKLPSRIWNARISVYGLLGKFIQLEKHICEKIFRNISSSKARHITMAAKGLKRYQSWLFYKANNSKATHNYYRALVHAVGIENVSVHTVLLSERIAMASMAVYDIQSRRSGTCKML